MRCGLSTGQMRGQKCPIILDTDEEGVTGSSTKKARVALPKQGSEMKEMWEWWEHMVDALEVANAEHQAACTQLAVVA